ncbi:Fungalysin metallopeptidase (M36), partial [Rhizoctonia solani]
MLLPTWRLAILATFWQYGTAAPWNKHVKRTTHHFRSLGPKGTQFQSYHPEPVFETYGVEGLYHPLSKRGIPSTTQEAAKKFLEERLGIKPESLTRKAGHSLNGTSHEYFNQLVNGIYVGNAVANVALKGDRVVSFGSSFVQPKSIAKNIPVLTQSAAIAIAEFETGGKYNNWPIQIEYFAEDSDHIVLVYKIQVQDEEQGEWYRVAVDAESGRIVDVVSFVSDASYRVIPIIWKDPTDGFTTVTDPSDTSASPNGWHQNGPIDTGSTSGNNVIAYKSDSSSGTTPQSSRINNFIYNFDSRSTTASIKNISTVNAFYLGNMMHDLLYHYGFTEAAYNFQIDNYGRGGKANDPVFISVQDSSRVNNANFVTLPDGQPGQMNMFMWIQATPPRDGALENDIVIHEYTHGLTNRLTGGGTAECLQSIEAQGLGEGWSDAVADWSHQSSEEDVVEDFTIGTYVNLRGIRDYPYSTNMIANPLTYGSLRSRIEFHDAGEVWAVIWHEIFALLVEKHGFSADKRDASSGAGNIIALHLLVDGLQLQPCNPTVLAARDAILQADANRYNGSNRCLLVSSLAAVYPPTHDAFQWIAFTKRGLGWKATTAKFDDFTAPEDC